MQNAVPANGEAMPGLPTDAYCEGWKRARQLGKELSELLEELGDCGYAYIRPAKFEFAVVFAGNSDLGPTEALGRLGALLNEAGVMLQDHPELKIERISIDEHGVHTFHETPGARARAEEASR
ncbi:hypothetical protein QM996_14000 [Sinorhizobium chiapasense]